MRWSSGPDHQSCDWLEVIDINEATSLNYWIQALDCSEFSLRMTVANVGPGVKEVGTALGKVI